MVVWDLGGYLREADSDKNMYQELKGMQKILSCKFSLERS